MARPHRHAAAAAPHAGAGLFARLAAAIAPNGRAVAPAQPRSVIMRDSGAGFLSSWRPSLRERRDEVGGVWHIAAARAIDGIQNSGWLSGTMEQAAGDTIGTGLRLNATPDAEAIGWNDDELRAWCGRVERRWRAWSTNPLECDARGKQTIAALTDAAIKHHFAFGEANALLPQIARAGVRSRVKVMMMSPHRHVLDGDELNGWYQGVRLDGNGMPIAYRYRRSKVFSEETIDFKARSSTGRPQVAHVFDGEPDQVRGISPLTPVLLRLRQYDTLAEATLTASLIQTIIAATIKSPNFAESAWQGFEPADPDSGEPGSLGDPVDAYMQQKLEWARHTKLDLGAPGRIAHLFPGEEFNIHRPGTPTDTYLPYSKALLREIARCLGMTYEAMTGDYEGATYSSVRMATSSIWSIVLRRRSRIAAPFVQAIYEAWLDEEVAAGRIPFPGGYRNFVALRGEACAAEWHGPAKPTADDLKSAKASQVRLSTGITSLAYEMAEYGQDPETVFEQRARERDMAMRLGLPDPYAPKNARGEPIQSDDEDLTEDDKK